MALEIARERVALVKRLVKRGFSKVIDDKRKTRARIWG